MSGAVRIVKLEGAVGRWGGGIVILLAVGFLMVADIVGAAVGAGVTDGIDAFGAGVDIIVSLTSGAVAIVVDDDAEGGCDTFAALAGVAVVGDSVGNLDDLLDAGVSWDIGAFVGLYGCVVFFLIFVLRSSGALPASKKISCSIESMTKMATTHRNT